MQKWIFILIIGLASCTPPKHFNSEGKLKAPDYSDADCWSALPFRKDKADKLPKGMETVHDSLKKVDVFYVYPTLYMVGRKWNASLKRGGLNRRLDKYPVRLQATAFNHVARIYAPRYRQANVKAFFDKSGKRLGEQALDFGYKDVKAAFEYYLEHYNEGRPVIIVGHSQGTVMCKRLVQDFFDRPERKKQLVCAYLVGMQFFKDELREIPPCDSADDLHCFLSWATYKDGYIPGTKTDLSKIVLPELSINPITWSRDTSYVKGEGVSLLKLGKKKYKVEARLKDNYLWIKTNAFFFKRRKDYHLIDYNLFWHEIRENVALRVETYFKTHEK